MEKPFKLSVKAVILDGENRCLLIRRSPVNHNFVGKWEWPGGKPDPGEDFTSALLREVREETALEVEITGRDGAGTFQSSLRGRTPPQTPPPNPAAPVLHPGENQGLRLVRSLPLAGPGCPGQRFRGPAGARRPRLLEDRRPGAAFRKKRERRYFRGRLRRGGAAVSGGLPSHPATRL